MNKMTFKTVYENASFDKNGCFIPNIPMYLIGNSMHPTIKILPKGAVLRRTRKEFQCLPKGGEEKFYPYCINVSDDPLVYKFFFPEGGQNCKIEFPDTTHITNEEVISGVIRIPFRKKEADYTLFIDKNEAKEFFEEKLKSNLGEYWFELYKNGFEFLSK